MTKVWSFNTTIRNPERMENMLRALTELEGQAFDRKGQRAFFAIEIKKRLYKPEKRTLQEQDLIDAVHTDKALDDIDDGLVTRIVNKYEGQVDAAARGRTTAGILNRLGLSIAVQSKGQVVITPLAKDWLEHKINDEELFTKFFLKWQYPNQIESGYGDFDIKPFVGTLSLISLVNKKWKELGNKPVGLSKLEYQLFVPSLTKAVQIDAYAERIIEFRTNKKTKSGGDLSEFVKDFTAQRVREIFGVTCNVEKSLGKIKDYTDSSIRYFHMSGLLALRGGDTHVDIAADKEVEVKSVLEKVKPTARTFASYDEYFRYLNDIKAVQLPWQNEDDLKKIVDELTGILKKEANGSIVIEILKNIKDKSIQEKVEELEAALNQARVQKLRGLKHNLSVLDECIEKLSIITDRNYATLTPRPSLDFEWYASQALMVLNDAEDISPNFKIGDDGIPTGFRANVPDIECRYKSFGMTLEVTLQRGRDQWYTEGQPVMRHLRDFEDKTNLPNLYCIFVAPLVHRDTLNTFWGSNSTGYEGKKQIIIPLNLEQFISLLKKARMKIREGNLTHNDLKSILIELSNGIEKSINPHDWVATFPSIIEAWN